VKIAKLLLIVAAIIGITLIVKGMRVYRVKRFMGFLKKDLINFLPKNLEIKQTSCNEISIVTKAPVQQGPFNFVRVLSSIKMTTELYPTIFLNGVEIFRFNFSLKRENQKRMLSFILEDVSKDIGKKYVEFC
jgi:hypothetical protein